MTMPNIDALPAHDCLEFGDDCNGVVEYRTVDGLRSWPRCEHHFDQRLERRNNSIEIYAESDVIPDWFDPANAGEQWFEDE